MLARAGTTPVHLELEALVAEFVGKQARADLRHGLCDQQRRHPRARRPRLPHPQRRAQPRHIVAGARGSGAKVKVRRAACS